MKKRSKSRGLTWTWLATRVHSHVTVLNNSKLFAGVMIILLNVASKFAHFKLSKSMEAYLKYTFSRLVLVFAIAWVGTRDIYTALVICLVFTLCMDFLCNEESQFCCLPEAFTTYHVGLMAPAPASPTVQDAIKILEQISNKEDKQNVPVM